MKPIPISAAKAIAEKYGYDQVIIVARKIGDGGREHCTTYGRDKDNCEVAARIGDFFKHELMGWPRPVPKFDGSAHDAGRCGAIFYGSGKSICDLPDGHEGQHSWYQESIARRPNLTK